MPAPAPTLDSSSRPRPSSAREAPACDSDINTDPGGKKPLVEAATPDAPAPTRVATEIQRIQSLLGRAQYAAGLEAVAALLAQLPPGHRDALYARAVSQRYLGRVSDALATLAE